MSRTIGGGHALVTGAAGAIGSAIARALALRGLARRFSLVDVDEAGARELAADLGGGSEALGWDLAKPDELPARLEALPPVDVLVNCAGVMEIRSLTETPWTVASRLLRIDLESPLLLQSLVAPGMRARRAGAIVNVSSMAGVTPLRGCSYYGAAKAGLAMASEIARLELEPAGVRVVTVYPGPVRSELERRARAQAPTTLATRLVPMGRPEPLGALVAEAIERNRGRVVYPPLYELASRFPRIASVVTAAASPIPRDA